jgi:D-alanine-D-alanine ligase
MQSLDVVFPVLHGTFGEDGTIQGLLELADIPYVGAGVLGSAAGMDKGIMKNLFVAADIPTPAFRIFLRSHLENHASKLIDAVEEGFSYPVFTKPANLGSSVGITKVRRKKELREALELAAEYDRRVIVEQGIEPARELECSVLGNELPEVSVVGEIVPANEFYDYEAKYISEDSELIIPAEISSEVEDRVREYAVRAFRAIDCAGMARVDFLLRPTDGKLFVNEINTIPGFTKISMYPKLWEATGLSYPALVDRLIELALERYDDRRSSRTTYG